MERLEKGVPISSTNTGDAWIDVSAALTSDLVHWPTDPAIELTRLSDLNEGGDVTVTHLSMTVHAGTHIDAPLHFLHDGPSIDQLSPDSVIGRARVVQIDDPHAVQAEELRQHSIRSGERLLLRTRNSERDWAQDRDFDENYVFIAPDAARFLVDIGVRLVGIDYLSIGGFHEGGAETHRILLSAGIYAVEGLVLQHVPAGEYDLICLPLRIVGAEGAPARALVRRIGDGSSRS